MLIAAGSGFVGGVSVTTTPAALIGAQLLPQQCRQGGVGGPACGGVAYPLRATAGSTRSGPFPPAGRVSKSH